MARGADDEVNNTDYDRENNISEEILDLYHIDEDNEINKVDGSSKEENTEGSNQFRDEVKADMEI